MKVHTNIKSGALNPNHNEKMTGKRSNGFTVKTNVKSGALSPNHNEKMVH